MSYKQARRVIVHVRDLQKALVSAQLLQNERRTRLGVYGLRSGCADAVVRTRVADVDEVLLLVVVGR